MNRWILCGSAKRQTNESRSELIVCETKTIELVCVWSNRSHVHTNRTSRNQSSEQLRAGGSCEWTSKQTIKSIILPCRRARETRRSEEYFCWFAPPPIPVNNISILSLQILSVAEPLQSGWAWRTGRTRLMEAAGFQQHHPVWSLPTLATEINQIQRRKSSFLHQCSRCEFDFIIHIAVCTLSSAFAHR